MGTSRNTIRAAAAATLLALPGCYSYVPVEQAAVPAGQEVRVYLSRAGLDELSELSITGPAIEGRLVGRENDRLLLRVAVGTRQAGFYQAPIEQEVPISPSTVLQLERRELSRSKTAALIGAGALGATLLIREIVGSSARRTDQGTPPVVESRIPLISIPFR